MNFPRREIVEQIRNEYPTGTRVELLRMDDPQAPPRGTRGTVTGVDDTGSILVDWDNGSGLNVVYGEDEVRKVDEVRVTCYGKTDIMERRHALLFFAQAIAGSEGHEQRRYISIYTQLKNGADAATDEGV